MTHLEAQAVHTCEVACSLSPSKVGTICTVSCLSSHQGLAQGCRKIHTRRWCVCVNHESAPGENNQHTHISHTPRTATRESLGVSHSPYRERERSFSQYTVTASRVRRREDEFTHVPSHAPHVTRTRPDREQHHIMCHIAHLSS